METDTPIRIIFVLQGTKIDKNWRFHPESYLVRLFQIQPKKHIDLY